MWLPHLEHHLLPLYLKKRQKSLQQISPKLVNSHQNHLDGLIALQVWGKIWIFNVGVNCPNLRYFTWEFPFSASLYFYSTTSRRQTLFLFTALHLFDTYFVTSYFAYSNYTNDNQEINYDVKLWIKILLFYFIDPWGEIQSTQQIKCIK